MLIRALIDAYNGSLIMVADDIVVKLPLRLPNFRIVPVEQYRFVRNRVLSRSWE